MTRNDAPTAAPAPCFPVLRPAGTTDAGQVRLGGMGPNFPANPTVSGKVRLGGMGPSFPRTIADSGRVRLGGMGPLI